MVTLLYTEIGNKQGQHAAKEEVGNFKQNVKSSSAFLIQLEEFVLTKYNFTFSGSSD